MKKMHSALVCSKFCPLNLWPAVFLYFLPPLVLLFPLPFQIASFSPGCCCVLSLVLCSCSLCFLLSVYLPLRPHYWFSYNSYFVVSLLALTNNKSSIMKVYFYEEIFHLSSFLTLFTFILLLFLCSVLYLSHICSPYRKSCYLGHQNTNV